MKIRYGKKMYDIDKMSSAEINKAIKKFSSLANTRITNLKRENLYSFSNTISRFHEPRMRNPGVATKKGLFKTNVSGSLESRRDRLQYMISFVIDPQTNPKAVKEYVKDDIRYLFGEDALSNPRKFGVYKDLIKDIYDAYRDLGFDRGYKDSESILTNVANIIYNRKTDLTPGELSTKLQNLIAEAGEKGYTLDDVGEFLAGKDKISGSKTDDIVDFLNGKLTLSDKKNVSFAKGKLAIDDSNGLKFKQKR
ncbi:MAG: hypothetical protein J6R32_10815 [Bacteroidales bacterium]|nr:hypothetical protein [Bacteroidales bacterium]